VKKLKTSIVTEGPIG